MTTRRTRLHSAPDDGFKAGSSSWRDRIVARPNNKGKHTRKVITILIKGVMNQVSVSTSAHEILPDGYPIRKSDIVARVMTIRSGIAPAEKKVTKDLSYALNQRALKLEKWDQTVDTDLAHRMIKHISSVKGSLSIEQLVQDIDIMMSRASYAMR